MAKFHPLITAAAVACMAAGAQAQTSSNLRPLPSTLPAPAGAAAPAAIGTPGTGGAVSQADSDFMKIAAQAGIAEVRAATLARDKSTDLAVRDFAGRMIRDHTRANGQLEQLARAKNVKLPTEPSVLHQSKLRLLEVAEGQDFDRRYADDFGIEAHRFAIRQFQSHLQQARDAEVKAFTRAVLPSLQQHLQMAQQMQAHIGNRDAARNAAAGSAGSRMGAAAASSEEAREVRGDLAEAVQVVQRMKNDPVVAEILSRAQGVFIMPDYGRGALGVGVQRGKGVLVTRQGNAFSNPVFYNLTGLSVGAQAGASGGEVALLLMTDKAVREFRSGKTFSLNADLGLTIADFSRRRQISTGKVEDVYIWSGTRGAFGGLAIGVNGVRFDEQANRAYYGRDDLDAARILDGAVPAPGTNVLGMVLAV